MALEGIDIQFYQLIGLVITISSVITVPITVFFIRLKTKAEQHDECITKLEQKIDKHSTDVQNMFSEHKIEANNTEMRIQKDIDNIRVRFERLQSSVDTISEKVIESEKIHIELKEIVRSNNIELKAFTIDWNQRIEDRIQGILDFLMKSQKGNTGASG